METRLYLSPFKRYFHFRSDGRHLVFRQPTTSGDVRSEIVKSGMVDNVGIAVGIATPSLAVEKLYQVPV